jgi:hydrogenase/urease accessory protein HupE
MSTAKAPLKASYTDAPAWLVSLKFFGCAVLGIVLTNFDVQLPA